EIRLCLFGGAIDSITYEYGSVINQAFRLKPFFLKIFAPSFSVYLRLTDLLIRHRFQSSLGQGCPEKRISVQREMGHIVVKKNDARFLAGEGLAKCVQPRFGRVAK